MVTNNSRVHLAWSEIAAVSVVRQGASLAALLFSFFFDNFDLMGTCSYIMKIRQNFCMPEDGIRYFGIFGYCYAKELNFEFVSFEILPL